MPEKFSRVYSKNGEYLQSNQIECRELEKHNNPNKKLNKFKKKIRHKKETMSLKIVKKKLSRTKGRETKHKTWLKNILHYGYSKKI